VNLMESVRRGVLKNLPHDGTYQKVVAALKAKSPRELVVLYLNWRERLIPPAPRRVLRSSVFDTNPIVHERSATIAQIVDDIEQGRDLTRYLSRRVTIGFELPRAQSPKNLYKRRHLDLLLNDWGIHHLHISTATEADGFVKREGPLIFAIFKPARAYLIDAGAHRDFTREQLIRIIIETWPDDGLAFELKGILGGGRSYTDEERAGLRAAGLSAPFVPINGRIFWRL